MSKGSVLFDKDCPLEAVVQLAEQRDIDALDSTLFDILTNHLPDTRIRIYHLLGQQPDDPVKPSIVKVLDSQPAMVEKELRLNDEDVQCCIADGNPVFAADNDRKPRCLFPIPSKSHVSAIVALSAECTDQHRNFLAPLIKIYASHAFLLNRNEHDSLTGLYNRFALDQKIQQIYASANSSKRRSKDSHDEQCLALIDIDLFKKINDKYGHLNGDNVLVQFAQEMRRCFRDFDLLFRYGGEEFVAIFRDLNLQTAEFVLQRFRKRIERYKFPQVGKVTVSIGYTALDTSKSAADIICQADRALYYAKNNGRNMASCYETLEKSGKLPSLEKADSYIAQMASASRS
jgi:diguanylate cyclase (GGDEF)-like protein